MTQTPTFTPRDLETLRDGAAALIARLSLSGYNNESILKVDAFVDSAEFKGAMASGSASLAYEVGAYLGEAIIRRHGGKWTFSPNGPRVEIKRNGLHLVDPFGKVLKRAQNGEVDQLLALVNLVEHVAARPRVDPSDVIRAADAALAPSPSEGGGTSGGRLLLYALLVFVVLPLVTMVVLTMLIDPTYALIGTVASIPLGLALLVLLLRGKKGGEPRLPPGTLGFEAELSLSPLRATLAAKLDELGPSPSPDALAEIAFHTAQIRELEAIVARRDTSPGRGYVGFDSFGREKSSWER